MSCDAGSHFEQRIYGNEAMTGVERTGPVVSDITLGFLYDSGWYIPDYSKSSKLLWGRGAGCDFAIGKCLNPGSSPSAGAGWNSYVCTSDGLVGCTYHALGYGPCSISTGLSSIPNGMRYWTGDGGKGHSLELRVSTSQIMCLRWKLCDRRLLPIHSTI